MTEPHYGFRPAWWQCLLLVAIGIILRRKRAEAQKES